VNIQNWKMNNRDLRTYPLSKSIAEVCFVDTKRSGVNFFYVLKHINTT